MLNCWEKREKKHCEKSAGAYALFWPMAGLEQIQNLSVQIKVDHLIMKKMT